MADEQGDLLMVPMRHCCGCGAEMGRYADYERFDDCGEAECQKVATRSRAKAMFERKNRGR